MIKSPSASPALLEQIEVRYRIVRPMFLGGADQSPELRSASFKGLLRFWWRALAWQQLSQDLCPVREQEDRLFGTAAQSGRQSSIRLRLSWEANDKTSRMTDGADTWSGGSWENYSGYGLRDAKRKALQSGLTIRAEVGAAAGRSHVLSDPIMLDALRVLGLCGGLGARARNGWGSLTLLSMNGNWKTPQNREQLMNAITQILHASPTQGNGLPPYTAVSALSQFAVGESFPTAMEAHRALIELYRNHVKSALGRQRRQFGLPRKDDKQRRRAKPLFLHVHQPDGSKAYPVALYLPARFLEDEEVIPDNGRAIEAFLNDVKGLGTHA
jgi:CRISPR-associated protein Cmr1